MKILVINTGSSSIKYQLFNMDDKKAIASGIVEKIGEKKSILKYNTASEKIVKEMPIANHGVGLDEVVNLLTDNKLGVIKNKSEVGAIGHRTVHGGEKFCAPAQIDEEFIATMKEMIPLAPLHNPPNLKGIEVAMEIFPDAPQVGVFDTAFHQTMPEHAYRYALPEELYTNNNVRRYGFHGTSHLYVSKEAASFLNKPIEELNFITVHIGNGASIAAVKGGKSIDTSMGLTPLEGLIMGTRSGDIDPAIPYFLCTTLGKTIEEVNTMLNKESGMKGITGRNDLREIEDSYIEGNGPKDKLGIEMYAYRIKKYIGSYYAALGKVDAVIFTAGVGENSDIIRGLACKDMENLGFALDDAKNAVRSKETREIQTADSKVKVMVVPTNEELEIACQTLAVLESN